MKHMRLKTAILAAAMALSLAVPAFAAADPLAPSLDVKGTTKVPTINLKMPTEPTIVVNPYELKVTVGKLKDQTDAIVSPVMSVENLSDINLQMSIKVTGKVGGKTKLVADNTGFATTTTPDVLLNLKGEIGDTAGTAPTGTAFVVSTTETAMTGFTGAAAAAVADTLAASTDGKKAAEHGVFNFQFSGEAATTKCTWTAKDTVSATLAFTFVPVITMPT